jgi:phospholipase C
MTSSMDRRDFVKRGLALGGGAALGSLLPLRSLWARPDGLSVKGASLLDLPAAESPIDTVVVLMMENRSFDHYLGWLAQDHEYLEAGKSRHQGHFAVDGDNTQRYRDPEGEFTDTYYLPGKSGEDNPYRGCHHPDPGHGWNAGRAQRDGGFLTERSGNDEFALGYYRAEDIPLYASLAHRFTAFDQYFCSILGPTFPNREYLHSAQSGGRKDNSVDFEGGFDWPTIWDRLIAAGVSSGYYFVDLPVTALWGARLLPITRHIEEYFAQAATGTLPNVTFIDPGFTTGFRTDDHPYADIRAGQKLVTDYIKAFVDSPHWQRGAFFITYDEWGGFFDHVRPPVLPDDLASADDADNFGQAGFRVPTLMASPFARKGFVDHELYDHASILRFIEWRFLGAPPTGPGNDGDSWFLTKRDRFANNIGASLLLEGADPEFHLPQVPEVPVTSEPCEGEILEGLPVATSAQPDLAEPHAFELLLDDDYFERVGHSRIVDFRGLPSL